MPYKTNTQHTYTNKEAWSQWMCSILLWWWSLLSTVKMKQCFGDMQSLCVWWICPLLYTWTTEWWMAWNVWGNVLCHCHTLSSPNEKPAGLWSHQTCLNIHAISWHCTVIAERLQQQMIVWFAINHSAHYHPSEPEHKNCCCTFVSVRL
jgi:hypothetical protein